MGRPKNYCQQEMAGVYTVTIAENKVVISDNGGNKTAVVRCHPSDTFDICEAMRIGMKRMLEYDKIHVGDIVKIIDNGESYCTEEEWPSCLSRFACKFRYGVTPDNGIECKVIAEFPSDFDNRYLVQPIISEHYCGDEKYSTLTCRGFYLMGESGLKKVNKYEA